MLRNLGYYTFSSHNILLLFYHFSINAFTNLSFQIMEVAFAFS